MCVWKASRWKDLERLDSFRIRRMMCEAVHLRQVGSASAFERLVEKSRKPAFVDFWVPGCSACEAMETRVERLEERWGDRVTFAGLDIDRASEVADRFHVGSIPHFAVFVDGRLINSLWLRGSGDRSAWSHASGNA